jgi:ferredoxin-nitrate reductase
VGAVEQQLTITSWDPVSKQPIFKVAAVPLTKLADASGTVALAPTTGMHPADPRVPATAGGPAAEVSERALGSDLRTHRGGMSMHLTSGSGARTWTGNGTSGP